MTKSVFVIAIVFIIMVWKNKFKKKLLIIVFLTKILKKIFFN